MRTGRTNFYRYDIFEKISISPKCGLWFIEMNILRFFDVFLSMIGLLFAFPVLLTLVVFGFFESGAPIFRQKRLGQNQRPFMLIKFRTMHEDTASVPTHLVNPKAITALGRFLRRTKLDELPQLWNVLRGEMSIVGPRPGLPNQDSLTKARAVNGVFSVKPGITGLAQIKGVDMSTPKLLARTDAQMIAEMTITSYFRLIFLTVIGNGRGDRVNLK